MMDFDAGLYKLVSEYYEAGILYGLYSCGDSLPSIPKICAMFHLAPATVRCAFSELEKKGYLKVDARKTAKVACRVPKGSFRKNAARYFVPREEGIRDLALSAKLLLEPLWRAGLDCWEEEDWAQLRHGLEDPAHSPAALPVEFHLLAIRSLKNRLALNLYWEAIRYLQFPYLEGAKGEVPFRLEPGISSREDIAALLNGRFETSCRKASEALFAFLREVKAECPPDQEEPVPFRWTVSRLRPQLRYSLASRMISGILSGQYPVGSYLPSLPKMMERYGVSRNTVRRSLDILEQLGVVLPQQGKGTLVYMEPRETDYSRPEIQVGLRLYLESLQLLTLTIPQVSRYTLEAVSPEQRLWLLESFKRLREEKQEYLCFDICLTFVEEQCPLASIRECYGRIRELLLWGYPFTLLRLKGRCLHDEYSERAYHLEQCLQDGPEIFSAAWGSFLAGEEQKLRNYFSGLLPESAGPAALSL